MSRTLRSKRLSRPRRSLEPKQRPLEETLSPPRRERDSRLN